MFEVLTAFLVAKGTFIAGAGVLGLVLNFILKKFVTQGRLDDLGSAIEDGGYYVGKWATLGLSHWPYTKPVWNNIIEPYVVMFVKTLNQFVTGIVKGLQSDNPSTKQ